MDKEVGQILKQLKEDGLNENTIVFFFSDHGSGMPRQKSTFGYWYACSTSRSIS